MFLRCRVVMATQCRSRTLHWRESNPWPWCWIFSWTALQGKARPESHTTEPWKTDQTQILNTFFYCYVIIVSPNVHFSLIKLNSSSHLCQNNPSSFSWLTHKMLWMVPYSMWEDISCLVLSVQPGRRASRVVQECPSGQICAERITRVEAGRHTAATVSLRIYCLVTKPHVSVCKNKSQIPVSPSSGDNWLLFRDPWFTFSPLLSTTSPPAGRESSVSLGRKKTLSVAIEGKRRSN